jgi:hypothetical protein
MKSMLRMATLAILVAALVAAANAQTAYAVDTNEDLYLVNLGSGGKTLLGNTGDFMEGLAYDQSTNRLFATSASGTLYELNPNTGAQMNSWATGLGNLEGLDFAFPNTLWMSDFANPMVMHGWDTTTNSFFNTLNTVSQDGSVRALAFNSTSTVAYFLGDQPTAQTLWSFDGNPAVAVGAIGSSFVAAMDMDAAGTMWGLDGSGNVGQFNLGSGAFTLTGPNTGNDFWLDMSMASSVPEPATMAILGGGVLALLRRRRK